MRATHVLTAAAVVALCGAPAAAAATAAPPAPLEWQWTASHEDSVPTWVRTAAARLTIAVIDTGADVTVPELAAKHPITHDVVTGTTRVSDTTGHGTFVASLAAGAVTGFGGDARLMIVQANRSGSGFSDADEAKGIIWAVDHGANIVNLSLGGPQTSAAERRAVAYAVDHGVLLVAAAGNAADTGNPAIYPAALIGRQGLVVGAATAGGARADFSSTGSYVDLLAPGISVLGAVPAGLPGGAFLPCGTPGYAFGTGTSFAAPEVAGAAALVWAANPLLDAAGVAATIEAAASNAGSWNPDSAFGDLDVGKAVGLALAAPVAGRVPRFR